jgi:rhomboid family GlyGly-CTERM serine protease
VSDRAERGAVRRLPPRPAGLAAVVAVLAALHAAGPVVVQRLRYERAALADGEWWRALGAHLVHHDLRHFVLNLAGLVLLWWLYAGDARLRDWALVALAAALAVTGGLWYGAPELAWYVGASGLLHGAWAAAGVAARARWPLESAVTLALLGAKLAWERVAGPLGAADGGLPVIVDAHLYGALGGLACALALRLGRRPL